MVEIDYVNNNEFKYSVWISQHGYASSLHLHGDTMIRLLDSLLKVPKGQPFMVKKGMDWCYEELVVHSWAVPKMTEGLAKVAIHYHNTMKPCFHEEFKERFKQCPCKYEQKRLDGGRVEDATLEDEYDI